MTDTATGKHLNRYTNECSSYIPMALYQSGGQVEMDKTGNKEIQPPDLLVGDLDTTSSSLSQLETWSQPFFVSSMAWVPGNKAAEAKNIPFETGFCFPEGSGRRWGGYFGGSWQQNRPP